MLLHSCSLSSVAGAEHLNVIASPEATDTTPAANVMASTGSNDESAYSGLRRTPDDRRSPVYVPLNHLESQPQVLTCIC